MRIWIKTVSLDKSKRTDSLALEFSVLKILFVLRYQLLSLNAKKPVLLSEWLPVITKSLLWLLLKNAKLLMNHLVLLKIASWKVPSSMKEWEVSSVKHAKKTVHAIVTQRM